VKFRGGDRIAKNLLRWRNQAERVMVGRMRQACLLVQRRSQLIVPVDTGYLKSTADTDAGWRGSKLIGVIFYTASYALFVHENLRARHKEGKQAKYLEQPLRQSVWEIAKILGGEVK
jgi:hypothetical protein